MDNPVSAESQIKDTLIYKATTSWNSISRYKYAFTYGYKKQLHTIMLSFEPEQFPHLIGVFRATQRRCGKKSWRK